MMAVWVAVNLGLFLVILVWGTRLARPSHPKAIQSLARALILVSLAFVVAATQRLGLQAVEAGLLSGEVGNFLLNEWQIVLVMVGSALALYALIKCRQALGILERGARMVSVLTENVELDAAVSDWGLTPRELQVVEVLAQGRLTDEELAEELFIAASTAATHVRNILRKAGLHNRREIMLVVAGRNGS